MGLLLIVLTIISVICTWWLISFAIKTARRIAVASEQSALMLEMLYESQPDEAKARVKAIHAARQQEKQQQRQQSHRGSLSEARWNALRAKKS